MRVSVRRYAVSPLWVAARRCVSSERGGASVPRLTSVHRTPYTHRTSYIVPSNSFTSFRNSRSHSLWVELLPPRVPQAHESARAVHIHRSRPIGAALTLLLMPSILSRLKEDAISFAKCILDPDEPKLPPETENLSTLYFSERFC